MPTVYSLRSSLVLAAALMTVIPAAAQQPRPAQPAAPQQPAAAPIKPYQPVAITLPTPSTDQSFAAFRTQLADVAKKKDRAALAKLVVAQGFFWDGENGDKADKKKPAIANLEQALGGFTGPDAQGWGALALAATDPTIEPLADHAGVMCGPAGPKLDEKAFEALTKATGTEPGDWAFPTAPNLEVRAGAQPTAPVVEKLGMHLVRVLPEAPPQGNAQQKMPTFARIVTPSGKTGFVPIEALSPTGFEQICYVKDASGWKITGYEGLD
jgi:hypothetical protein